MNPFRSRSLLAIGRRSQLSSLGFSYNGLTHCALGQRLSSSHRKLSTKNDIFKLDIDLSAENPKSATDVNRGSKKDLDSGLGREEPLNDIDSLFDDLVDDSESPRYGTETEGKDRYSDLELLIDEISEHSELKATDRDFDTTSRLYAPDSENSKSVVEAENELFRKIFETYSKAQEDEVNADRLQKQVLMNLHESFTKQPEPEAETTEQAKPKLERNEVKSLENLHQQDLETLEKQSRDSISQTIQYLNDITSKKDLLSFAEDFFGRFNSSMLHSPKFFLHKLKGETAPEYITRHQEFCQQAKVENSQTPEQPVLNVFTMPLIFNHMLDITCRKFYDGSLALSLFNMTKNDLNLYSIICNQRTYNEIIMIHWVFFGKSSLCEIELILVEMMNNGFEGDLITFSTLKEILTLHHKMRIGDTIYNPGGSPIWSKEDEKRARNIEEKFKKLGRKLSRKRFMNRGF